MSAIPARKRHKYGAKKTTVDDIIFDSQSEAKRYGELRLLQRAGAIKELVLQPRYTININDIKVCAVVLDFEYFDIEKGIYVHEDVKGYDTDMSKLKRKMFEAYTGAKVTLIKYGK